MSTWIARRMRLVTAVIVSLLLLSLFVLINFTQAKPKPIYFLPPQGEVIVYLNTNSGAVNDLPISIADLNLNGVIVVSEFADLREKATSGPDRVDAVIIHGTRVKDIDPNWIQDLYRRGVVIAGVNVTIRELGRLVRDDYVANDATWTDGWQKEPFYSVLAFRASGTSEEQQRAQLEARLLGQAMRSTDNISNPSDVDVFLSLIRRDIRELREQETSTMNK